MTKKASIRSLISMARSLSAAGSGCARPCAEPLPSGTVITFLRHARAVANEGIEAAFRGILARHGRPEALRAPLIHAFHAEGRRAPRHAAVEAPVAAISNTDDDLIAGGLPFTEVSDVAEAARLI
jgi:hypothetical protein